MSLIQKEPVIPKKEQLTFRLNPDVITLLDSYCHFISSAQNYVVEQALMLIFRKDRQFQRWIEIHGTTGGEKKGKRAGKTPDGETAVSEA